MDDIQGLLAKLLLLQEDETHDPTEIISRIITTKDVGLILDFRARCINVHFLIANNIITCKSETEKASWLSQCVFLIKECDKALLDIQQEAFLDWLSSQVTKKPC